MQVSVQGSTESMRSRWFLSMERWRVWSGVGHGKPGKRGPGRWPEILPEPRDGQGRDLTRITISRSELRLSEPASALGQCKLGRIRMEISVTRDSVTTRGETFPIVNVSWCTLSGPNMSGHRARPPLVYLASLFTHTYLRP